MRTIVISEQPLPKIADIRSVVLQADVVDEFAEVIRWLVEERLRYQAGKFDYAETDLEHAKQGLADDSWFWDRGVLNYAGRVRMFQRMTHEMELLDHWWDNPLAIQALLKLVTTMASIPEHLLRGALIESLPQPGLPSGALS